MMEFGRKMMILRRSRSRWPISNRKVALICLKQNSGDKKTTTETKFFIKMPFRRPKRWNLAEKRWTSYGVLSIKPFPIERLHQFVRTCILAEKIKPSTETEIFKKNAISKAETTEFAGKTMNLLWSLGRWPISTWKASQIFANLNSGAKRKRALKWQF